MTARQVSRLIVQGLRGIGLVSRVAVARPSPVISRQRAQGRVVVRFTTIRTAFKNVVLLPVCRGRAVIESSIMTVILPVVLVPAAIFVVAVARFIEAPVTAVAHGPNCQVQLLFYASVRIGHRLFTADKIGVRAATLYQKGELTRPLPTPLLLHAKRGVVMLSIRTADVV